MGQRVRKSVLFSASKAMVSVFRRCRLQQAAGKGFALLRQFLRLRHAFGDQIQLAPAASEPIVVLSVPDKQNTQKNHLLGFAIVSCASAMRKECVRMSMHMNILHEYTTEKCT